LAGKEGSRNLFLMVQHSNHNLTFRSRVFEKMKIEVDESSPNPSSYSLLADQVNLNTGKYKFIEIYRTE
jgi:hypothetical protein